MKLLHRPDMFAWSRFDEQRDIDFHGYAWVRPGGNVLIDPLPMSDHDRTHLRKLGGASLVVITNSDHIRGAVAVAEHFGAKIAGPLGEREDFPLECDRWVGDGEEVVPGMQAVALEGGKTRGELALVIENTTLVTGDFVRSHAAGRLHFLPEGRLRDHDTAIASLRKLVGLPEVRAVLVGDGWPTFGQGHARLLELLETVTATADAAGD